MRKERDNNRQRTEGRSIRESESMRRCNKKAIDRKTHQAAKGLKAKRDGKRQEKGEK